MNLRKVVLWGMVAGMIFSSCQNPTEPIEGDEQGLETKVSGSVLRSDNLSPVANALVFDLAGQVRDTSNADGSFRLDYRLTSAYATKIVGSAGGFKNDTVSVSLSPGRDTTIVLKVKADSTSPVGGLSSGKPANIVLVGTSAENIGIRGAGNNETSVLTFEVRDSLGVPVGGANKLKVQFSILGGPGGGEYIFPVEGESDALSGRVSTRVTSGTKAGVLQVYASATVAPGKLIKSSPVRLTISGGLPVDSRFSISREVANIAGGVFDNLRARINVVVGDNQGNPVQEGTAVYFTTTGGIIQASASTSVDGIASVELISGNPRPTNGIAVVTARTVGDSGASISRTIPIVFSGPTRIIAPTTTFEISDSSEYSFAYKVQDPNGNPLTAGTTINVTTSGPGAADLEVVGDNSVTLGDTDNPAWTTFFVTVRDKAAGGASGPVAIKIDVVSQNGNATASILGTVKPGASVITVPPSAREPAQIAIIGNPTATDIFIAGVGAVENSVITYEVRDSLGTPIDTSKRVSATFNVSFFPNSFVQGGTAPRVIPSTGVSDNRGRFTANVTSGTQAGVVQLVARVLLPNGTVIVSQPTRITVHAGFPDQNHFTLLPSNFAFAGLDFNNTTGFTVAVGDTFSNPVPVNTAVYWHTQAGIIQTGSGNGASYTNSRGFAGSELYTVNPRPLTLPFYDAAFGPGYHWVYAQTQGRGGKWITDSVLVLVCGGPLSLTGLPTTFTVPQSGASALIPFVIRDRNNNPLPTGTTVTASVSYDNTVAGIKFVVGGDFSEQFPTYTVPNAGFARFPGSGVTNYQVRVSDVSNGGGIIGMAVTLTITVNAPGIGVRSFSAPGSVVP